MTSLLRQFIKGVLTEAAVTPEQAASQGLALYFKFGAKSGVLVLYDPAVVGDAIASSQGEADVMQLSELILPGIRAAITVNKPAEKCNNAWEVTTAGASKGFGPMMYDIAMSLAPSQTLTSDRSYVSSDAESVWRYYFNNRSDVEKLPFDDVNDPKTPPTVDDCEVHPAEEKHGKDVNPLNYAYRKKSGGAGRALNRNHEAFLDAISPVAKQYGIKPMYIEAAIQSAGSSFFSVQMGRG